MTIQKADASIIIDTKHTPDTWCIYEHHVVLSEGEPPTVILIGACKVTDVYKLIDGKVNSEWSRIFANGGSVLVRIIGTTLDRHEAYREAQRLVRDTEPRPMCNIRGYNLRGKARSIICLNNDKRYATQFEAADDLNINASSISRHLRGTLNHANGFKFAYAPEHDG